MNDNSDSNEARNDEAIRQELARSNSGSSKDHDDAVLARAALVAKDIAERRQAPPVKRSRPGRFLWLASAAAVLAAVLVMPMLWIEGDDGLRRPNVLVVPGQGAQLGDVPEQFEWPYVPGADSYILVLRNAGAEVLWRSASVSEQRLEIDGTSRLLLETGGTYIWTVEASTPSAVVELGPFQFSVVP